MIRKRCIKPQCGRIYKEGDKEFERNECECGAPLEIIDDNVNSYEENVEYKDIPSSNDEECLNNVNDDNEEQFNEKITMEDPKIVDFNETTEIKKFKCTNSGCCKIYEEGQLVDDDGFCPECGYPLQIVENEEKEQSVIEKVEDNVEAESDKSQEVLYSTSEVEEYSLPCSEEVVDYNDDAKECFNEECIRFTVDNNGYIHFPEEEGYEEDGLVVSVPKGDEYKDYTGNRIVIYNQKEKYKTVPLVYDEMIIGRKSTSSSPDVDLGELDAERRISRNHAMIYKYQGEYYIRNLSSKNSLHVNSQALLLNEQTKLEDGAKIVLSRFVGIKFYSAVGGEDYE